MNFISSNASPSFLFFCSFFRSLCDVPAVKTLHDNVARIMEMLALLFTVFFVSLVVFF